MSSSQKRAPARPRAGRGANPVKAGNSRSTAARGNRGGASSRTAVAPAGRGGPAFVIGSVSPLGRVAGALAVAAACCHLLAPAFPLVRQHGGPSGPGGSALGGAANAWDFLPPLVLALVLGAAGLACLRGVLPRLGLAVVATVGAASVGLLAQAAFLYGGERTSRDLPLPVAMVRTVRFDPATGLHLTLAADALAVAALVLVVAGWSRTWMDDDGGFDALRPMFGGLGLFTGFVAAAGVCLAIGDSDSEGIGPASLLARSGLDAWGTAALAVALLLGAVVAASLRPRLAAVGAYAGLCAVTAGYALRGGLLVARADLLHAGVGLVALFLAAAGFAALAVAAWRMSPGSAAGDRRA